MSEKSRITLSSLTVCNFRSEETTCFEALLRFDGEIVGIVSNEGRGGCPHFRPDSGKNDLFQSAVKFAASLPPIKTELLDDSGNPIYLGMNIGLLVEQIAFEDAPKRSRNFNS